jgi:AhpD family alkylhydroperoxidase
MYPEFMAEEAAEYFDEFNMLFSDTSPIARKEARLVAVAVSAALRCEYCIAAQIESAKNEGATDEEIKAAIQIAGEIQRFSTLLYGNEFSWDQFNKMIGRDNE